MPVFEVAFEKRFSIFVRADTKETLAAALPRALREIERNLWGTGKWEARIIERKYLLEADHGLEEGTIVAIEDLEAM